MKLFAYVVRRLFAFGADWYISSVLINLFANGIDHFIVTDSSMLYALMISSLIISFIYYVIVPYNVWKGQTLMMRAMHVKVVDINGKDLSMNKIIIRFFIGCLIFEGAFYMPSVNIRSVLLILMNSNFMEILNFVLNITSILGVLCICLDFKKMRLFHDLLSNSVVIDNATIPN